MMSIGKLPQTDSIQELARFWDTHDLTDFEDELEVVEEPAFERRTVVAVPLETVEAGMVEQLGKGKGLESAELIREWGLEKIDAG